MLGLPQPMQPPVEPSADEARQWAVEELSKAIYTQGPSLLERLVNWLSDLWERLMQAGPSGAVLLPLLILVLLAAIITVALVLGGPVRRRRLRRTGDSVQVLDDDDRASDVLRAGADLAAARGEYDLAVLERFRALVRALDERTILTDRRGRTAHEAASEAGSRFPDHADDLQRASELFDAVCYGSAQPGPAEDSWLADLDQVLESARPLTGQVRAAAGWSVVQ